MEKLANIMKNHIGSLLSIMLVMLISIIGLTFSYRAQVNETNLSKELVASQTFEMNKLKGDVNTLTLEKEKLIEQVAQTVVKHDQEVEQLNKTIKYINDYSYTLPDYVVRYLNDYGFNSASELLSTLKDQNDLIPVSGVLGGKMQWWPELSAVLNERLVFGYFEDGHILGHALLEYTFDEKNTLKWRVIDFFLD